MLRFILSLVCHLYQEPCSLQREIMNRLEKKRLMLELSDEELLLIYEHIGRIIKQSNRRFLISPNQFKTLLRFPRSALNFLSDKKVPVNKLEDFRTKFTNI